MTFIMSRLQPADLLLRRLETTSELLLGKAGLLAQGRDLEGDVPGLAGASEPLGELRVPQVLFQEGIKIGLFHASFRFSRSRLRSRAVSRSRAATAWPLLRMPCANTIRRPFIKNQRMRVLSLPTWRSSNSPSPNGFDNGSRWYWRFRNFASPATTAAKSPGSLAFSPSRNSRTGHRPASLS